MGRNIVIPVVLAGGKGTRLWPMSRSERPKQFLPLTGDLSLFQQTLRRLDDSHFYGAPIVITNEAYRFLVAEQALEIGVKLGVILLEPVARNTAAAIVAASLVAAKNNKNTLVHVLASDHEIDVDDAYNIALATAKQCAQAGRLATFGITPTEPATGFGYIEAGQREETGAYSVTRFVEKPNVERAQKMLDSGDYYWNSGMFMFDCEVFLSECEIYAPIVLSAAREAVKNAKTDLDFVRLDAEGFSKSPDISVDYAIFENTSLASVVPSPITWSDLGTWDAVWKAGTCDEAENVQRGPTYLSNTTKSLAISEKSHLFIDGLDDVCVIASDDVVYVGRLSQAQSVGNVVKNVRANALTASLAEVHSVRYRPWGGATLIDAGDGFQVKRVFVKPGKSVSLQKHNHRSEHWVVVRGRAEVQLGDKMSILHENESIYIPRGLAHRLHNSGDVMLELIEIQTGPYIGDDDVLRLEGETNDN